MTWNPAAMRTLGFAILILMVLVSQSHGVLAAQKVRPEIDHSQQHLFLFVDGKLQATLHFLTARSDIAPRNFPTNTAVA
jgi:hypothetical protein